MSRAVHARIAVEAALAARLPANDAPDRSAKGAKKKRRAADAGTPEEGS